MTAHLDRRQQKTQTAIIQAFVELLGQKSYNKITVQDIIDRANVGRSTFYAHFETRDSLLEVLLEDLFAHIIKSASECAHIHGLYSSASSKTSVFCHLLQHLLDNDHNIIALLSCDDHELFLRYFKENLKVLVHKEFLKDEALARQNTQALTYRGLPLDFVINHIASSFVEMVLWWIKGGMKETPLELDHYFRTANQYLLAV